MIAPRRLFDFLNEDPALDPEIRARLRFKAILPKPYEIRRTATVENWDPFQGMVLTVVISDGEISRSVGSAVLIGHGIALCAAHVIQPDIEGLKQSQLACVLLTDVGGVPRAWQVKRAQMGFDLCILSVQLACQIPDHGVIHHAALTTRLPAIGERLSVLGFRPNAQEFISEERGVAGAYMRLISSMGQVTQQFRNGRDKLLAPWPCLEIDCPAWGAMSGGPVFDDKGFLVGLIARSWETADEPSPMICALLFPAFGIHIDGGWPEWRESTNLLQVNGTHCVIEKPEAIQAVINEARTESHLSIQFWS